MTMSITVNSTHRINIDGQFVDLTTQQLVELRDQIDQAISVKRTPGIQDWREYSRELTPFRDWVYNLGPMCGSTKLYGPVNAAQTHIQP